MDPSDPLALQPERLDRAQPSSLADALPRSAMPAFLAARRDRRRYAHELVAVRAHLAQLALIDNAALSDRTEQAAGHLRKLFSRGKRLTAGPHRSLAMAVAAAVAERSIGLAATDAQLVAALAMCDSRAVELTHGAGKTFAVGLAAALAGWSTRCVHVVCASEPLAVRNAVELAPFFQACGLSLSVVTSITPPEQFAECYKADILYGVARRFMADTFRDLRLFSGVESSLRRRLLNASDPARARATVTRGLLACIVDDMDRVLADEATNPLVISEQSVNPLLMEAIVAAGSLVRGVEAATDYRVLPDGMIEFTEEGLERLTQIEEGLPPLWRVRHRRDDLIKQAIVVRDVFKEGVHYAVSDGRLGFHDERVAEALKEKTQLYGLTQALEAHLGLEMSPLPRTVERVAFQGFFVRYPRLSGTASNLGGLGGELFRTYGLHVFGGLRGEDAAALAGDPPPSMPLATAVPGPKARARLYAASEAGRLALVLQTVTAWSVQGAAIIVSTRRPEEAEQIMSMLRAQGISVPDHAPDPAQPGKVSREDFLAAAGMPGHVLVVPDGMLAGDRLPLSPMTQAEGGLRLLITQPLETARAQESFFHLGSHDGGAAECVQILSWDDKLLAVHLPSPLPLMRRYFAAGRRMRIALDVACRLAQFFAARAAQRQRKLLLAREASLKQQLSFAGFGRYSSQAGQEPVTSTHSEAVKG